MNPLHFKPQCCKRMELSPDVFELHHNFEGTHSNFPSPLSYGIKFSPVTTTDVKIPLPPPWAHQYVKCMGKMLMCLIDCYIILAYKGFDLLGGSPSFWINCFCQLSCWKDKSSLCPWLVTLIQNGLVSEWKRLKPQVVPALYSITTCHHQEKNNQHK